jgi:hypothetical protein
VVAGVNGQPVTVTALELGRTVNTDAQGRFVIRGVPAGQLTLVAGNDPASNGTKVDVPDAAGSVRGVKLGAQ